jgi:hypothetical protein
LTVDNSASSKKELNTLGVPKVGSLDQGRETVLQDVNNRRKERLNGVKLIDVCAIFNEEPKTVDMIVPGDMHEGRHSVL